MKSAKRGFTLVEIMIVVAIIGILAVIAIPSFMRARRTSQTNTCMNNLRVIESAIQQWAMETNQSGDDVVNIAELLDYLNQQRMPICPLANVGYIVNTVDGGIACPNYNETEHPATLGWIPAGP